MAVAPRKPPTAACHRRGRWARTATPRRASGCPESGMSSHGVSPLPREARPYQGQRAGLVSRFIAAAIDAAVVGLVVCLGYAVLAGFLFVLSPRDFSFP